MAAGVLQKVGAPLLCFWFPGLKLLKNTIFSILDTLILENALLLKL